MKEKVFTFLPGARPLPPPAHFFSFTFQLKSHFLRKEFTDIPDVLSPFKI